MERYNGRDLFLSPGKAKNMSVSDQHCDGCDHRERCAAMYEKLGRTHGPSVTVSVLLAFVVPIIVFAACLWGGQRLLSLTSLAKPAQTGLAVAAALGLSFVSILAGRAIERRRRQRSCRMATGELDDRDKG